MKKNHVSKLILGLLFTLSVTQVSAAESAIKQQLAKEGFKFIKQIDAPSHMTGWAGHMQQNPATVFIANDQKYYIVGDLYNAKGSNLSVQALDKHVKQSVLNDVWQGLEQSAWIQDGNVNAAQIVYVFSDPNCPYCHTFWQQARPWVKSGKVQLRHIQVAVIRPESRGQAASLLAAENPQKAFEAFSLSAGKKKLTELKPIPQAIAAQLDHNQALMEKYGFYATPAVIWKNSQGELQSMQGIPKDLKTIFR